MAGSKHTSAPSRLGLLALLPLTVFLLALHAFSTGRIPLTMERPWIPTLGVDLAFRLDSLGLLMLLLITGIGALVFVYAAGYMAGVPARGRLFTLLTAFMVAMIGCVTADDLVVLFVFWELTSVTSFLLVGFKHEDETSRKSAQQALIVTAGGGLVMLAGILMLAHVAGTTSIQTLLASAHDWRGHPLVSSALVCLFVGAFTKSAQFPFHFWLPGAMAAPTPVSAYLHSATMVKLGVYLLARLHPAFQDERLWQLTLVTVGGFTSVWAMVLTIRERDLKRILAWSTVSALGTLVMLIGLPGDGAATATAAFLLAHALYKAPLFFVAGNVDHATGTRLIDALQGLGRRMPFTAAAGCLAGLSMAGIPLSFGFIAKDVIKVAKADAEVFRWVAYAGVFVSAASFAAAGVATVRIFWGGRDTEVRPAHAHEGSPATWLPPLVIASLGIVFGMFPALLQSLLTHAAESMGHAMPLAEARNDPGASVTALAIVLALGVAIFLAWDRLHQAQKELSAPQIARASGWYEAFMAIVPWTASRLTRALQRGRLSTYAATIFVFVLVTLGVVVLKSPALSALTLGPAADHGSMSSPSVLGVTAAVVMLVGSALFVCLVRSSFVMLLVSGVAGLASALVFVFVGAPDVAFTQLTVEVAFVVVIAAILLRVRRLDPVVPPRLPAWHTAMRIGLGLACGGLTALLMLLAHAESPDPALTTFFSERSVPDAHGRNVVNVILVDFRAVDTLGEIAVVLATFLASVPLLTLLRDRWRRGPASSRRGRILGTSRTALLLDEAVPILYPVLLVCSVLILLRGHNEPGGGFIAGMVAVAATSMLAVARGARFAERRMPLRPWRLAAASVLLSLASGLPALAVGKPYMTHAWMKLPLVVTELDVSTVLLFDLGVYGAVWGALGALCARALEIDEPPTVFLDTAGAASNATEGG